MNQKQLVWILGTTISAGLMSTGMSISSQAANISVIDSGVDFRHPALKDHTWVNPKEVADNGVDDDGNGYIDDVNGWNFAEKNNKVIDYSYLGKFPPEMEKFFAIQLKVLEGTATDEEKEWMAAKKKDKAFIQKLGTFANFVHGTHVAGIASMKTNAAKIMAVKLIPTEQKKPSSSEDDSEENEDELELIGGYGWGPGGWLPSRDDLNKFGSAVLDQVSKWKRIAEDTINGGFDDVLMQGALGMLAGQQVKNFEPIGKYVSSTNMKVANCSFGTGAAQAQMIAKALGKLLLKRDLTDEEAAKYGTVFMNEIVKKGTVFTSSAAGTLFVIAAGNEASNNDEKPVFPANLGSENSITVAATRGYDRLASFSNYGSKKVDIAAPGVGILSAIPGGGMMVFSGTSQASPFVARVAGKVLDANPTLTPSQVKAILMKTVDKKDFLADKVASGGIVNEERAVQAAVFSLETSLRTAIHKARMEVMDVRSSLEFNDDSAFGTLALTGDLSQFFKRVAQDSGDDGFALPLPGIPFSF